MLEKQTLRIIKDPPSNLKILSGDFVSCFMSLGELATQPQVFPVQETHMKKGGYRESTFAHGLGACASATQNVKQIAVNESGTFQRRTEMI